jgi:hypothetical protein
VWIDNVPFKTKLPSLFLICEDPDVMVCVIAMITDNGTLVSEKKLSEWVVFMSFVQDILLDGNEVVFEP